VCGVGGGVEEAAIVTRRIEVELWRQCRVPGPLALGLWLSAEAWPCGMGWGWGLVWRWGIGEGFASPYLPTRRQAGPLLGLPLFCRPDRAACRAGGAT
jgi:hypothetical protein